jgi:hypothetical protein
MGKRKIPNMGLDGLFSSVNRKFGEDLRAKSPIGLISEAMQKMWIYDEMVSYGRDERNVGSDRSYQN